MPASASVTHPSTGVYCINGLTPAPKTAVPQLAFGSLFGAQIFAKVNPVPGQVCEGLQIGVGTYDSGATSTNQNFMMIIH